MLVPFVIALLTTGAASVSASNYATYTLLKNDRAAGRLVFPPTTLAQKEIILSNVKNALAPTVVVTSTSKHPDLLALFGEDYSKIQAGDELLAINGLSFFDWFEQNKFTSGAGANEFGGQRAALKYLTTIYGKFNRLPSEDFITFHSNPTPTLRSSILSMSRMSLDAMRNVGNLGSKLYKSITDATLPGTPETSLPVSAEQSGHNHKSDTAHLSPRGHKMDSPEDPKRGATIEKRSSFGQESAVLMNPTDVTEITWGIYKPESTNMGIIKLDSFDPEELVLRSGYSKAVMIIRSLLVNELKYTKSVMYDLRGNSGGNVEFANNMVQLFKPDFKPFGDRFLMNKITHNLFVNKKNPNADIYAKAWEETVPNSRFTNVVFLNSVKSANTMGQVYLRPMGVLNDGRCYSSCEVFSGAIQGHGAGTIFGEDGRTGGGGASVMELDPFLIRVSPTYFQKFPFTQELTSGSTTYANTLSPGSTTNTQYDRIAKSLARIGRKNVEAVGIEEFTVFQADGETIIAQQKASTTKQRFSIPVSTVGSALGNSHITIVGKTAGKQVLKTKRNVRIIPADDKYMKISTPGFTFSGLSDSVGLYQSSTTASGDGWNNLKGPWDDWQRCQYVAMSILPLRLSSLLPLAPRSILVSMSLSTPSPIVISSTCLSRAAAVLKTSSLRSKSLDGTRRSMGSLEGDNCQGNRSLYHKSESFLFLSSLLLIGLQRSLVLLSTRSLSLLLEIV
ncbi:hypothetical protein BASA61_000896 [Batrachochytrium salamandrivorans]|nr:hypothetical protein BASA61_000896 [Batrachochytrium salamandrivorans]